jgi:outer membrane protein OmpA-like peptidoglycan-associated protein
MKLYKITISIIFLLLFSQLYAVAETSKLDSIVNAYYKKQANNAYAKLAYVKAIELYTKIIKNEFADAEVYSNLADANYKIGETIKSEESYKVLINNYEYKSVDLYRYAQALRYNGKYKESDIWMKRYLELNPDDSRAKRQLESSKKVKELKSVNRYEIENVDFNSKYADFGTALRGDKIYFSSERRVDEIINYEYAWKENPYNDIYQLSLDGKVTKPKLLEGKVNSKFHDGPVCFSDDETEMFFTRNNSYFRIISKNGEGKVNNLKIFYTKFVNNEVSEPVELPFNSNDYSCGHPSLSKDGSVLYFSSNMPGGYGEADIYMVERTEAGWSEPKNLGPEINTEGNEMFPFIEESGVLYFSSNGHSGMGGLDIYKAQMKNGIYSVENMGYPMNSNSDDFSLIIDKDQKEGYFSSNREGGKGDDDIYKFTALKINLNLQGKVYNQETKQHIKNSSIVLKNNEGEQERLISSSDEFDYRIEVDPNIEYTIQVNKDGYNAFQASFIPSELYPQDNLVNYDVFLKKIPFWGIYGNVYLLPDMTSVPEVTINVEPRNGEKFTVLSSKLGDFKFKLEPETDYDIVFTKQLFFTKRVSYSTVGVDTGYVNLNEFVELAMDEATIGKSIEIQILYDLGKWNIREDAAMELDDMIQFLQDNPTIKIELGSHTDARGSSKSNQALSQKRAESAVNYMIERGIIKDRIDAKGYGETKLKNRCADGVRCSEEEHQVNRRSEVTIIAR